MSRARGPTRRLFLTATAAAGGGLLLGLSSARSVAQLARRPGPGSDPELNVWVVVRPDDSIVIRVVRSELGQGTTTGLAQLVAEELDCDWSRVTFEVPPPGLNAANDRPWREYATSNSRSIRTSQDYLRVAGAAARWMLLKAAAEQWKVAAPTLHTDKGIVSHPPTRRTISYGRLAATAAKMHPPHPRLLKLKEPQAWRIISAPVKRLDSAEILTGRAVYGVDVRLPGMLSASIRQAPVFGSTLVDFDAAPILGRPGVRHVLKIGDNAVAVVADTWWQAERAISDLSITWSETPEAKATSASIADHLKAGLDVKDAFIGHTYGDALRAISGAARKVEAVYTLPYVHHATLEPMNCTARWTPEKVEVWAPTQNAEAALRAAAAAADLPAHSAEVYRTSVGGSFGRRSRNDFVTQAVLLARQVPGTPVKLIWSRAEDTQHGFYRPGMTCRLTGGVDEKGDAVGLIARISGQSIIASQTPQLLQGGKDARIFQGLYPEPGEAQIGYSIPNVYIDHAMRSTHLPVGSWRGVHCNQNAFMLESFVDEMARAADRDPLDFRRSMMRSHPRHLATLTAAAEKAGWGQPAPEGRHRGIAQSMGYGTCTAAVAEISVGAEGRIRVHKVLLAVDCGNVVNPDQVTAQVEGSVAFALGTMFHQEITIDGGRVVERDFDTFGSLRMHEMPLVEAVLVPSGESWGGVGSAVIAVVAPAVVNAIHSATGKRVRALPIRNARLT
jgi:isoquinoline 1-oxidoreductase beta subunit